MLGGCGTVLLHPDGWWRNGAKCLDNSSFSLWTFVAESVIFGNLLGKLVDLPTVCPAAPAPSSPGGP